MRGIFLTCWQGRLQQRKRFSAGRDLSSAAKFYGISAAWRPPREPEAGPLLLYCNYCLLAPGRREGARRFPRTSEKPLSGVANQSQFILSSFISFGRLSS